MLLLPVLLLVLFASHVHNLCAVLFILENKIIISEIQMMYHAACKGEFQPFNRSLLLLLLLLLLFSH